MTKFEALQILGLTGHVCNEDIKIAYRRKAQQFHPDKNPAGEEMMKMLNVAYDLVRDLDDVEVYDNPTMAGYPEVLEAALNAVLHLAGIIVEVCGLWVWVSGDTRSHKENLKAAGYRWAPKKCMWYFRPNVVKRRRWDPIGGEWSIDKIKETYGVLYPKQQENLLLVD